FCKKLPNCLPNSLYHFRFPPETEGKFLKQKIIKEQDTGFDAISSIVSCQKQMGQEIGNELDGQNEIINSFANLLENTDEKLCTETRHLNMVDRNSTSCRIIMVIWLLLMATVAIAVWPTN
uniref:Syntaxin-8 n=1 Tax=Piliocolobus tephrosceles TaxID=591936 RepID=A0A8C9H0Z1_9PRIM